MDNTPILEKINQLVAEEHLLRAASQPDRERIRHLEETLDQCWDLLRRRDALKDAGKNPDDAKVAPVDEVEGYLQ